MPVPAVAGQQLHGLMRIGSTLQDTTHHLEATATVLQTTM